MIKWPLHAWNDPAKKAAAFSLSQDRIYILSLADPRVRCLLKQKNTLCHQLMTVPANHVHLCTERKASEQERKSFLSISHHVIEQWGIRSLHSCGDGVFKLN